MNRTGRMAVLVLALGLVAATSGRADAQGRGGIGTGWGGVDLLLNPIVQSELRMDAPEVDKARALVVEIRGRQKGLNSLLEGLEGEDRTKRIQELAADLARQEDEAVGALLGPARLARYRQVDLQQRGATAMADPLVAVALRLTPEQSDRLRPILNRSVLRLREAAATSRGDRRAAFEMTQAIRRETDGEAVALLTEDQKAAWQQRVGQPLDLNPPARGGR